jgi:Protein of unknown function (DUF3592)
MQAMKPLFKQMTNRGLMIMAISVLAGAPLMFYGAMQCLRLQQLVADGTRTRGQVVRTIQNEGGFFPVVRIETSQGTVRFTDRSGSYQPEFREGEELEVFFPQYEPEKARIYSWKRVWFTPALTTAAGLLPMLIGVLVAFFTERNRTFSDEA